MCKQFLALVFGLADNANKKIKKYILSFRLKDCTGNTNNTYCKSDNLFRYCKT